MSIEHLNTPFAPDHIELGNGKITKSDVPSEIGTVQFFVEVVERNGGRLGVWCGPDYGQAILEAERAKVDFGVSEVHDTVEAIE